MFSVYTKTKSRRFQISPVLRAFSRKKLRFRDGLVWTVGPTLEIKLRLQISPIPRNVDGPLTAVKA